MFWGYTMECTFQGRFRLLPYLSCFGFGALYLSKIAEALLPHGKPCKTFKRLLIRFEQDMFFGARLQSTHSQGSQSLEELEHAKAQSWTHSIPESVLMAESDPFSMYLNFTADKSQECSCAHQNWSERLCINWYLYIYNIFHIIWNIYIYISRCKPSPRPKYQKCFWQPHHFPL